MTVERFSNMSSRAKAAPFDFAQGRLRRGINAERLSFPLLPFPKGKGNLKRRVSFRTELRSLRRAQPSEARQSKRIKHATRSIRPAGPIRTTQARAGGADTRRRAQYLFDYRFLARPHAR